MNRIAVAFGGDAGSDSAEKNREEGAAFDQRIAGRQFAARKMVRQHAVFDRTEQRPEHAEHEQDDEQQAQRGEKANPATASTATPNSTSFTRRAHQCFIVTVGELAAETGQEEVRSNEDGAGDLNERRRRGAGR